MFIFYFKGSSIKNDELFANYINSCLIELVKDLYTKIELFNEPFYQKKSKKDNRRVSMLKRDKNRLENLFRYCELIVYQALDEILIPKGKIYQIETKKVGPNKSKQISNSNIKLKFIVSKINTMEPNLYENSFGCKNGIFAWCFLCHKKADYFC